MWYQLQIEACLAHEVEALSEDLNAKGALSITLMDKEDVPLFEPTPGTMPLWPKVTIHALYDELHRAATAQTTLTAQYPHLNLSIQSFADEDWERTCLKDFKPTRYGQRLWVCPSWMLPLDPKAVNLILDPGLAFGTGSHPTTSLCLSYLDEAVLSEKIVIDYGCGSGILALAAIKLGALKAYAVDIDKQALEACLNNARVNNIDENKLSVSFPAQLNCKAHLLIANILLTPLLDLKEQFHSLLRKEGLLVVSGILSHQAPMLIEAYQDNFSYHSSKTEDEWSLLTFTPN